MEDKATTTSTGKPSTTAATTTATTPPLTTDNTPKKVFTLKLKLSSSVPSLQANGAAAVPGGNNNSTSEASHGEASGGTPLVTKSASHDHLTLGLGANSKTKAAEHDATPKGGANKVASAKGKNRAIRQTGTPSSSKKKKVLRVSSTTSLGSVDSAQSRAKEDLPATTDKPEGETATSAVPKEARPQMVINTGSIRKLPQGIAMEPDGLFADYMKALRVAKEYKLQRKWILDPRVEVVIRDDSAKAASSSSSSAAATAAAITAKKSKSSDSLTTGQPASPVEALAGRQSASPAVKRIAFHVPAWITDDPAHSEAIRVKMNAAFGGPRLVLRAGGIQLKSQGTDGGSSSTPSGGRSRSKSGRGRASSGNNTTGTPNNNGNNTNGLPSSGRKKKKSGSRSKASTGSRSSSAKSTPTSSTSNGNALARMTASEVLKSNPELVLKEGTFVCTHEGCHRIFDDQTRWRRHQNGHIRYTA